MLLLLEATVGSLHFDGSSYPTWQDLGKHFPYLPSPLHCSDPVVALFVPKGVAPNSASVLVSLQCEDDGQMFFSLDDGNTKFSDLIQLVDFYQLNKGVLPCKLKHHCIRVAL